MQSLPIRSGLGDYTADFYASLAELVTAARQTRTAVALVDEQVARQYAETLAPLLTGVPTYFIPATEEMKTYEGIGRVLEFYQQQNCTKQSVVLAIGGGITQDIAAFSTHIYYRGIPWVFIPTTLLAMSDSCIGAKCGINFGKYKNQLGVFSAPSRILVCSAFLDTLSDTDIVSGYGEILKLLLTGPAEQYHRFADIVTTQGFRNDSLGEFIAQSLAVKRTVIEADEFEKDLRRILNYGHTFGHALEAVTEHEVPHGIAVAWGIDIVNYLAMRLGLLAEASFQQIHDFIAHKFSFSITHSVTRTEIIDASRRDKKVLDAQLTLILLADFGKLIIEKLPFDERLNALVDDYLSGYNVITWP